MDRLIVAAFVATFIAAIAAIVGVPVFAQTAPATASDAADTPRGRFAAMDTDHDGKLSQAEWLAAGRHERGFALMDADHDGFLSPDELKLGIAKLRAAREAKAN